MDRASQKKQHKAVTKVVSQLKLTQKKFSRKKNEVEVKKIFEITGAAKRQLVNLVVEVYKRRLLKNWNKIKLSLDESKKAIFYTFRDFNLMDRKF